MNSLVNSWATLNHNGLLISSAKLKEYFPEPPPLPRLQVEKLRRALTAFDGNRDTLAPLLDYLLQDLLNLPAEEWQKARSVKSEYAIRSYTGVQVKPRRVWVGPNGEVLPMFVPEEGTSRQFSGRLGVGRSRRSLARVLEWLRQTQQPLAVVTNGRQWRLVLAGQDYDAWCEWDIDLWFEEGEPGPQTLVWRGLLSRDALLAEGGQSLLLTAISESRKGQADLSSVLGERVREAVEELITASHDAIEKAQQQNTAPPYNSLYIAGSRIIMRCIIALFAEARGLLPVDNPIYQQSYSLEGLRQQLIRRSGGHNSQRLSRGHSAWPRLLSLFSLIYHGSAHPELAVLRYGGALFQPGDAKSEDPTARALALLESPANAINDRQMFNLLELLTRTRVKIRQGRSNSWITAPVDFSVLSSEYIGILYEGLLDYELKQAEADDPIIFLGVGNQPALPLSRLEEMDDKTIKQLFEALKKKEKSEDEADDEDAIADDSMEEVEEETGTILQFPVHETSKSEPLLKVAEPAVTTESPPHTDTLQLTEDHRARTQAWLEKAASLSGLVKKPRGNKAANQVKYQQALAKAGQQLCARLVAPSQFYLVRWGGTRKGAGTYYTRPQLAVPTVRRTLQPLAYNAKRTEIDERTGLEEVVEWIPKKPEQILALKVCDPSMGSGSFLASALRYLTDALLQSLYHHKLIEKAEDGGVPRLADGKLAKLLSDEVTKLKPDNPDFEETLRAQLKRHIVERCLYGVDLDPLAVELGRIALWVETMDRELPLGFLDHKLKTGNALIGAWFDTYRHYPAMAWRREGGDVGYQRNRPDNLINHFYEDAKGKKKGDVFTHAIKERNKVVPEQLIALLSDQMELGIELDTNSVHDELFEVFNTLHNLPVHDTDQRAEVYGKQMLNNQRYHALKSRMDLWCALWFWPGEQIEQAPLPRDFNQPSEDALAIATEVAQEYRFFHWELEFPDVFTAERQGFDAVVGNPPWEVQKPISKEFFSNHDPLYRAYGKQEALTKQLDYFRQQPQLEHDWIAYKAGFKGKSNWTKYVGYPFGNRVTIDAEGKQNMT
ncbi:MAG: Eco57I restriction-modification methylase domain-containing protein [Pseudohongiellaceae bacterium]